VAAGTCWLYVAVVRSQGDAPVAWVLGVLVAGALGAAYASHRSARARLQVLATSTVLLAGLGLVAILSIGLLILLAAGLCLASLTRSLVSPQQPAAPGP
jgi:uncharacterized membrane protein YiaA